MERRGGGGEARHNQEGVSKRNQKVVREISVRRKVCVPQMEERQKLCGGQRNRGEKEKR